VSESPMEPVKIPGAQAAPYSLQNLWGEDLESILPVRFTRAVLVHHQLRWDLEPIQHLEDEGKVKKSCIPRDIPFLNEKHRRHPCTKLVVDFFPLILFFLSFSHNYWLTLFLTLHF
jgi:hypothetical protein